MTKKKRELIEIFLDNVKPEDWPENYRMRRRILQHLECFFIHKSHK